MTNDDITPQATPSRELPEAAAAVIAGTLSASPVVPAVAKRAFSWNDLVRRITNRTTDLVAIGIVIVVSLTMGRQVIDWWGTDAPAVLDMGPLDNSHTEWGADSRPVMLEFGSAPITVTRQTLLNGGQESALATIRDRCQQVLVTAAEPADVPDHSELDQLDALKKLSPDIEQPGMWQLYLLGGEMATIVGVKTFAAQSGNPDPAGPPARRRVICWGLVFPGLSTGTWTAYTFVRRPKEALPSSASQPTDFELARLELPKGCQRTVMMQEAGQTGLLGFRGRSDPVAWQQHFESWLKARGWRQADPWVQQADRWSCRFVSATGGPANESSIQIQFHLQNKDQGVGLIHWLPAREPPAAQSPPATQVSPVLPTAPALSTTRGTP